jgi:hypothetical protein
MLNDSLQLQKSGRNPESSKLLNILQVSHNYSHSEKVRKIKKEEQQV